VVVNLWALDYILEVAKTGSISKAAQNLYLSQPHLSNTIKSVENDLDVIIFRRSAKGMTLTDEGQAFVDQAGIILSQVDKLERMFRNKPDEMVRSRISMTRSYQLLCCISNFINRNKDKPHLFIHIKETNPFQVIEDVRHKEAELGILHFFDAQKEYFLNQFKMHSISSTFQYARDYLLAMSVNNPLAKQEHITSDMLVNQLAIIYGDYEIPMASYDVVTQSSEIVLSSKRIYVYDRATAMEMLSQCPDSYMWITGLHQNTLTKEKLVLRKCEDASVKNLGYSIQLTDSKLSPATEALLHIMENVDWTEKIN